MQKSKQKFIGASKRCPRLPKRGPDYFDPFFSQMPDSDTDVSGEDDSWEENISHRLDQLRESTFNPQFLSLQDALMPQKKFNGHSSSFQKLHQKTQHLVANSTFEVDTAPETEVSEPLQCNYEKLPPQNFKPGNTDGDQNVIMKREKELAFRWKTILKNSEEKVAEKSVKELGNRTNQDVYKKAGWSDGGNYMQLTPREIFSKTSSSDSSGTPRVNCYLNDISSEKLGVLYLKVIALCVERRLQQPGNIQVMYSLTMVFNDTPCGNERQITTEWFEAKLWQKGSRIIERCSMVTDIALPQYLKTALYVTVWRFDTHCGKVQEAGRLSINVADNYNFSRTAEHTFSSYELKGILQAHLSKSYSKDFDQGATELLEEAEGASFNDSRGSSVEAFTRTTGVNLKNATEQWYYLDDFGIEQGPYNSETIINWIEQGYFEQKSQFRRKGYVDFNDLVEVIDQMFQIGHYGLSNLLQEGDLFKINYLKSLLRKDANFTLHEKAKLSVKRLHETEKVSYLKDTQNLSPQENCAVADKQNLSRQETSELEIDAVLDLLQKAKTCLSRIESHKRSSFLKKNMIPRPSRVNMSNLGEKQSGLKSYNERGYDESYVVKIQAVFRGWLVRKRLERISNRIAAKHSAGALSRSQQVKALNQNFGFRIPQNLSASNLINYVNDDFAKPFSTYPLQSPIAQQIAPTTGIQQQLSDVRWCHIPSIVTNPSTSTISAPDKEVGGHSSLNAIISYSKKKSPANPDLHQTFYAPENLNTAGSAAHLTISTTQREIFHPLTAKCHESLTGKSARGHDVGNAASAMFSKNVLANGTNETHLEQLLNPSCVSFPTSYCDMVKERKHQCEEITSLKKNAIAYPALASVPLHPYATTEAAV